MGVEDFKPDLNSEGWGARAYEAVLQEGLSVPQAVREVGERIRRQARAEVASAKQQI